MKILVIGESCNDVYVYGKSNRLAPEAPVPIFLPLEEIEIGGMAMNVFENVKSLDFDVEIITNQNWKSIIKKRFIDNKTNQMFLRVDTNDNLYEKIDFTKINFSHYNAVIISDYDKGFISKDEIFEICDKHDKVFLDTKKILGDWANKSLYIKINNYEYEMSKNFITDELRKKIIVTLGENGSEYDGTIFSVPKVDVKDTCGAGDTFIAALTCRFLETENIKKAIMFANKCATQVIQKRGTSKINLELL